MSDNLEMLVDPLAERSCTDVSGVLKNDLHQVAVGESEATSDHAKAIAGLQEQRTDRSRIPLTDLEF